MNIHEKELALFFDGACEPNPGGVAAYGWLLESRGEVIDSNFGVVCSGPKATNNVAEYSALGFGLKHLAGCGWQGRLYVFGDSQLVINQISGAWACNKEHLQKLRDRCRELLETICPQRAYTLQWIPRDDNAAADELSRKAYEIHTGKPFPDRRRTYGRR